jgi:radical SAM superfamily enzyme YgiQ (UPF0313 family)
MKVLTVATWQPGHVGHERTRRMPPLTAVHLAGLVPPHIEVEAWHEQVRPLDPDAVDADLVAITSMTANADRTYRLAARLRARGIKVVLGGSHITLMPQEAVQHADAIVTGEADRAFPRLIRDFEKGRMEKVYAGGNDGSLDGLPPPRHDLYEDGFPLRCYIQATRGCPWQCTFCTLKAYDHGFRVRPVDEVIRDIERCEGKTYLEKKFVWFWDDNLIGNRPYARELFTRMKPMRKWWWSQVSIDLAKDERTLRLAADSGCVSVFVGIETFSEENLVRIKKKQNKAAKYREAMDAFHDHGITVSAGIIVGLDEDTPASIRRIPEIVDELGIDQAFCNLLAPFPGTALRKSMEQQDRLLGRPWEEHDTTAVTFLPAQMTPNELENAYWVARHRLASVPRFLKRRARAATRSSLGGMIMNSYADLLVTVRNAVHPDGPHPIVDGTRPSMGPWEEAAGPPTPPWTPAASGNGAASNAAWGNGSSRGGVPENGSLPVLGSGE